MAEKVFRALDPDMKIALRVHDGDLVSKGTVLLHLEGRARAILTGERTALNFLGRLCGIATMVHQLRGKDSGHAHKDSRYPQNYAGTAIT